MCKICIFAGTVEGRKLMSLLAARGVQIAVCVATEYGQALLGDHPDVRIYEGRMEESQMETFLRGEAFDVVVDATHPYAARVTENIAAACRAVRTEYLRLLRNSAAGGEDGVFVSDAGACVEYLMATRGKILLTTGSKELRECVAQRPALRARASRAGFGADLRGLRYSAGSYFGDARAV